MDTQEGGGFLEQVGAVRREIEATVQQLILHLKESERQLMMELDQVTETYLEKTQMVECMGVVCSLVKDDNLRPLEETTVRFVKSSSVLEACRSLGSVVKYGQLKVAHNNKLSFDLFSAASNSPLSSELVSCQLYPVADPTLVLKCFVHTVAPGRFEVSYSSPTAGLHQLRVQVGGTDILDTPLTVEVVPKKAGQTFTGLSFPAGVAITNGGHLIVAEHGKDCITIINSTSGEKIRSFGQRGSGRLQFRNPRGVAVTHDGHIVVADCFNHRLQVLTAEGAFVSTVGSKGSQPLCPWDIAIHPNGKLFVTDSENHRIQVLNADFSYSHCFGSEGDQPGEFYNPRGITIDSDGTVYIVDYANDRVQKFTPEGKLLAVIKSKGEGDRLYHPRGLCVDGSGILYVTEYGSRDTVCVFTTSGQFLGYVGDCDGSTVKDPSFITSDQTGKLYISTNTGVVTVAVIVS